MKQAIMNLDDQMVIKKLNELGLYDLFHEQAGRAQGPDRDVVMEHQEDDTIYWFVLHKNYTDPKDNGYLMIHLSGASGDREAVEVVRQSFEALSKTPIEPLYVDEPGKRN
jgi:hypothetical protein